VGSKHSGLLDILGDEKLATPVLLLGMGCLCAMLGFLGYCGAIRENYCLTVSFAVLLSLLMLTGDLNSLVGYQTLSLSNESCHSEIAAAIAAYALHEPLHNALVNQLTQVVLYNLSM